MLLINLKLNSRGVIMSNNIYVDDIFYRFNVGSYVIGRFIGRGGKYKNPKLQTADGIVLQLPAHTTLIDKITNVDNWYYIKCVYQSPKKHGYVIIEADSSDELQRLINEHNVSQLKFDF